MLGERMRASLGQTAGGRKRHRRRRHGRHRRVSRARRRTATPSSCGHFGTHVTNGAIYPLTFDLVKDFEPISLLPRNPYLIVSQQGIVPPKISRSFMAWVKDRIRTR